MNYFDHQYASNSDLKRVISKIVEGNPDPDGLDIIYNQGTLNHHALMEPHKADRTHKDFELANLMAKTVLKDDLCRKIIMMQDFRREHEFYRSKVWGIRGRCKTDGDSKSAQIIFEYKGLGITTEKAFEDAIMTFSYDQASCWYLDTTRYYVWVIAAVSKKQPDRLFKRVVTRDHLIYRSGVDKVKRAVRYWRLYFE